MNPVDVVIGLQHGDEGKGKVVNALAQEKVSIGLGKTKPKYDVCLRFNGGGNAGHTVYVNGEKFVTHYIPTGVLHGIPGIIGPGCVINPARFIRELLSLPMEAQKLVKVAGNAHVVLNEYLEEDFKDTKIGTTRSGNGQAYANKYARTGVLVKDFDWNKFLDKLPSSVLLGVGNTQMVKDLFPFILSPLEYRSLLHGTVLCEGAQGIGLDIDWGEYPYVTSSHCGVGGAILNGIAPQRLDRIIGVAKCYETYVGTKPFEPGKKFVQNEDGSMTMEGDRTIFDGLRERGNEFGATTGRPRQCNWLDLAKLVNAIRMNGVTHVILNKFDIINHFGNTANYIDTYDLQFDKFIIEKKIKERCSTVKEVIFSSSPREI